MWVILGHLVILWQVVFKLKMVKMKQCEITIQSNRCGKWPTWSKFITMSDWLCHKKYIIHNIKYQGFTFLSGCALGDPRMHQGLNFALQHCPASWFRSKPWHTKSQGSTITLSGCTLFNFWNFDILDVFFFKGPKNA